MAQLPPKAPSMAQNWPSSSFQMMTFPTTAAAATISHHNSWIDEFIDFSGARRSSHRRTVSDPIDFVESPFVEDCRNSNANLMSCNNNGFERLDDEQLKTMFSDDVTVACDGWTRSSSIASSTNPSTPSDQNSDNDEKTTQPRPRPQPRDDSQHVHVPVQPKNEPREVDSSCKPHTENSIKLPSNVSGVTNGDPKWIKRILANRQSAQRSRVRKLHYISELERSVNTLQNEVSALSPRVAFLDHQRVLLNVDNSALKQRIAALAQDKIFKDAHQEALKEEIERLRQIYHEQQNMNMNLNKIISHESKD